MGTGRGAGGANDSRVYEAIRSQILDGRRSGGEWLREEDLASELGVSRTPVREALRRLTADGLVRHERHRGVQVQEWSLDDLEEIFELRGLLEPVGARLAATSSLLDVAELEDLATRIERAATVRDIDTVTTLNNAFHAAVVTASGSHRLGGLLSSLVQVPVVHSTFAHYTAGELARSLAQHREILEALRSGDPTWAESVMRSHIRHGWVAIRGRLTADG